MSTGGLVLVGLAIAVGVVGVIVPVIPGSLLAWAAILVWAIVEGTTTAWTVFAGATVVIGGAQIVKYLVPGRRLRDAGVPNRSIVVGFVLAIAGFFLIPVVGLFIGFPVGVYAEERRRLRTHDAAWRSTKHALHAIGLSIAIELAAVLLAAAGWLGVVVL